MKRALDTPPVFHLLAGPNGAGKSTLYRALVLEGLIGQHVEFVNADLHESAHLMHIRDAARRSEAARIWADTRREELINARVSFVSETVFSHESKLALIQQAQAAGFVVQLLVVALDNPRRLLQRVTQRVAEGGHNVPADRVLERYPRTLANLVKAVRLADLALLYDSQDVDPGTHALVAICRRQATRVLREPLPKWTRLVLGLTPSGTRSPKPSPARRAK